VSDDKAIQPDLFGLVKKQEQSKQEIIDRNKADKKAGVKPLSKPLFEEKDPEDNQDNT